MATLRVVVAGAAGLLGRRLVAELADRGHVAVGLTSDRAGDERVADRGGVPRRADVLDADELRWAVGDADVVVHAAAVPNGSESVEADRGHDDRVRRVGARNLTAAAAHAGASRYVQASVVWVVQGDGGERVDESSPPSPGGTTATAVAAERRARAARKFDLDPVVLRTGWLYGADATHVRRLARALRARRFPIVGGGFLGRRDTRLSILHADDAATAFADACEGRATGTFHVVDDEPVSPARFLRAFADRLDAPRPIRVPGWLARPLLGRDLSRFLPAGYPTSNGRFESAFGWEPVFPDYRAGLDRVIDRWHEEGRLFETANGSEWVDEPDDRGVRHDDRTGDQDGLLR